jgi:site-specific DNA-methyltransferase (adenine-specific)
MNLNLPQNKYGIIYADPPWRYNHNWLSGACERSYSTMDIEDIKNLPIKDIIADKAHLYLWVTNPFIAEGLEVCKAWGFEYKTLITWVKLYKSGEKEMGMGYYFRSCTEHIIFGIKGGMRLQKGVNNIRNEFEEVNPRYYTKKHSSKPDSVRDLIVRASGDLPRLELFAREKIDGWDVWGNEISLSEPIVIL